MIRLRYNLDIEAVDIKALGYNTTRLHDIYLKVLEFVVIMF